MVSMDEMTEDLRGHPPRNPGLSVGDRTHGLAEEATSRRFVQPAAGAPHDRVEHRRIRRGPCEQEDSGAWARAANGFECVGRSLGPLRTSQKENRRLEAGGTPQGLND